MATLLTVASQKGGVGKTTTSLNLAYSLGRFGDRVLLVDADPQGSLGIACNLRKRTTRGLLHVLRGQAALDEVLAATRDRTMAVASLGVTSAEDALDIEEHARSGALATLVREAAATFDFAVIDAPSGVGGLVTAVLRSAEHVIVPVLPRSLALRTLPSFLRAIQLVRHENPRLRIAGLLISMFDAASRVDGKAVDEIQASFPEDIVFRTVIPHDDLFEEATERAVPVALVPGGQRLAGHYMQLALEVRERTLMWESNDGEIEDLF
jgi:chromosome partitioning protein